MKRFPIPKPAGSRKLLASIGTSVIISRNSFPLLCEITMLTRIMLSLVASVLLIADLRAQDYTRAEDVIYGRKYGTALTMDVFTPTKSPNGAGVIFCVSGGWFSSHANVNAGFYKPFLDRGYVVFAVVHGSQPKFTIPEVLDDMNRAVRFIRANDEKYGVSKDRLGIAGASAGGHLSLMQGTAYRMGDPKSGDVVEQESSKVAAVGCFFPPTDFLNYGKEGETALGENILTGFKPPFDFHEADPKTKMFMRITDQERRKAIGKQISPIYHIKAESAPALIIHGDADTLVPIQQAEIMIAKYKEMKVPCELVVKKGAGHGWTDLVKDIVKIADWFDKYLAKK
jgi:acetyl esterase/lipase